MTSHRKRNGKGLCSICGNPVTGNLCSECHSDIFASYKGEYKERKPAVDFQDLEGASYEGEALSLFQEGRIDSFTLRDFLGEDISDYAWRTITKES